MELQEQVNALTDQVDQYKDALQQVDAERIALDQMYVESLKESVKNKKENILINGKLNELNNKLLVCEKEKEALQARVKELEIPYTATMDNIVIDEVHCEAC